MADKIPLVNWLLFQLLVVLSSSPLQILAQAAATPAPILKVDQTGDSGVNRVLRLSGANARFDVPVKILAEVTSNLTIAGWVRPANTNYALIFEIADGAGVSLLMQMEGEGFIRALHFTAAGTFTTEVDSIELGNAFPGNQWSHFVLMFEGTNKSLYINGGLLWRGGKVPLAMNVRENAFFKFGGTFGSEFDNLAVYNSALSHEEIQQLVRAAKPPRESLLLGFWKFDDPAKPAEDSSPRRNHGSTGGSASAQAMQLPSSVP